MTDAIETEIFRLTPATDKYYETATYTRRTGNWPNEKYYTFNPLRYVGKFIKHEQYGFGDGARVYAIFDNNGKMETVQYTYEGTTCFREVDPNQILFYNPETYPKSRI